MPSQICKSKKQSRGKRKPFRADCEVGQGSPRIQICESSKILGWAFYNAAATESLISSFKPFNHAAVSPINLLIHRTGCNYFFPAICIWSSLNKHFKIIVNLRFWIDGNNTTWDMSSIVSDFGYLKWEDSL